MPYLSICIPTFNRANQLQKTLSSIVEQTIFQETDDIEIVISDNASKDETYQVICKYKKRYPEKIQCFRQEKAIDPHHNFEFVLEHGNGHFIKLHTDATLFRNGELDKMVCRMKKYPDAGAIITHSLLCTSNDEKDLSFHTIEDILQYCTLNLTTITLHAYNRRIYHQIPIPFRYYKLYFPHVDILFQILERGYSSIVLDGPFYSWLPKQYVKRNDAYIFGQCYLTLLQKYVQEGMISEQCYAKEKRTAYFMAIIPNYFDFHHNLLAEPCQGYRVFWKNMKNYKNEPYFYLSLPCIFIYKILCSIPLFGRFSSFLRNCFLNVQKGNFARRIALDEQKDKNS